MTDSNVCLIVTTQIILRTHKLATVQTLKHNQHNCVRCKNLEFFSGITMFLLMVAQHLPTGCVFFPERMNETKRGFYLLALLVINREDQSTRERSTKRGVLGNPLIIHLGLQLSPKCGSFQRGA